MKSPFTVWAEGEHAGEYEELLEALAVAAECSWNRCNDIVVADALEHDVAIVKVERRAGDAEKRWPA